MSGQQRVVQHRRQYNQWVGNQTLEDFALRYTAASARRSPFRVGNMAVGAVSFLACEAIGGSITLAFGFANAIAAIAATGMLMFLIGLPICAHATRNGVDVDLLTRGAGFGYLGSTVTSLIYASFTFILFAIEASIMSAAIVAALGIPLWLANIASALAVVPIAAYGVRAIGRMQLLTQPVWLVLQFGPLLWLALHNRAEFGDWTRFGGAVPGGLALIPFGLAASILLSLLPQIGEQVDYLRFLPQPAAGRRAGWWGTLLFAGPGWVVTGCAKLAAGSFLTYFAVQRGLPEVAAAQPATMYRIALTEVFHRPVLASLLMLLFVSVCQVKINTTNAYAGSIAWSNFFSRLTHAHPGRVVWVAFNAALALLLMEIGIFRVIQNILGLYANFACGWMGALAADLVVNKRLGLSPPGIEFKRAHLYAVNPVGTGAMALSVLCSTAMSFGLFGAIAHALAPFAGLAVAFAASPAIAIATRGRYYIARRSALPDGAGLRCVVCDGAFERPDMAACPAYGGPICSLCCTLDARCGDLCKPVPAPPAWWPRGAGFARVAGVAGGVLAMGAVLAGVLTLIGLEYAASAPAAAAPIIRTTLVAVFVVLFILGGIGCWAFVLARASRKAARDEVLQQSAMLMEEIAAHQRTDAALAKAKAAAESANHAKSRYIVGVVHEVRAPLNAIFGYAQLLERADGMQTDPARVIRRSAEHLSNLVDGLLDISQIETGSLTLHRDRVNLGEFLDQIGDMFRLAAAAKGIGFRQAYPANLPAYIHTDEKRLRQVLINLLSNAVKYTEAGEVTFRIRLRGQVAEFTIADTGIGIRAEDLATIFEPFERGHLAAANALPGTGLGLTISDLLTRILGGEITAESTLGQGSAFRVRLLLSPAAGPATAPPERRVTGYEGAIRRVLLADDDPDHLELLTEFLIPLGFDVRAVPDGEGCLAAAAVFQPDLVILDIAMPGLSGLDVAAALRRTLPAQKLLIVSGNFHDAGRTGPADAFLPKPIDLRALLATIGGLLDLVWVQAAPAPAPSAAQRPSANHLAALRELARIGYVRGLEAKLAEIAAAEPATAVTCNRWRDLVRRFALAALADELEDGHAG